MFKYIEKLRQKPDSVKKRMAFLTSFSFVGIIFIVWLSIIYPGFREQKNINDRVVASEPSPFSTFGDILSQSTSAIGEQFSKITEISTTFSDGVKSPDAASTTSTTSGTIISTSTTDLASTTISQ